MIGKVQNTLTHETVLFWVLASLFALLISSHVYFALLLFSGPLGALLALLLFLVLSGISLWVLGETRRAMVRKISDTRRR